MAIKATVSTEVGVTELEFDGTENDLFTKVGAVLTDAPIKGLVNVEVEGKSAQILMADGYFVETMVRGQFNHLKVKKSKYSEKYFSIVGGDSNRYEMYHLVPNSMGAVTASFTGGRERIGAKDSDLNAKKSLRRPVPSYLFPIWCAVLKQQGYTDVTENILQETKLEDDLEKIVESNSPARLLFKFLASCSRQMANSVFAGGISTSRNMSSKVHFSQRQVDAARQIWNSFSHNLALKKYEKLFAQGKELADEKGKFSPEVIKTLRNNGCHAKDLLEFEVFLCSKYMPEAVKEFNDKLHSLMAISPRRIDSYRGMSVKGFDAKVMPTYKAQIGEFQRVITREEDYIRTMEALVLEESQAKEKTEPDEMFPGITAVEATEEEAKFVKDHMDSHIGQIRKIYKITDARRANVFDKYCQERHIDEKGITYLWHGSRNENWLSIIGTGLSLNPNAAITGKMFGNGIYFAPDVDKSFGYTSAYGSRWANGHEGTAYMGLYSVATGKLYHPTRSGHYSQSDLDAAGCDSLWARCKDTGLYRDEVIVYSERAMCLRYLIEFAM